ncbi:MAG: TIR domain-containing protein [Opitutaceae bacterium]|nr:TIR domain-containing protein [Opitutaceae bacterium]
MPAPRAIFVSYARDDAAAARRIAEALRGAGLEVWFDENELTGGDLWDQKIRTQIAECALFVSLISANTQARLEGYFRLEWRLAEQRSHLMAKGKRFLVPVCIDDTREKGAQVPEAFLEVQWTRLAGGEATPQFVELVKRLVSRELARVSPGLRSLGEEGRPVSSDDTGQETRATKTRVPAAAWIGAVAVAVIAIAATFFATRKPEPNAGAGTRAPTVVAAAPNPAEKSIAVLAFENVGGDKENEIFSDGVPEEIMTQLGKVAGLRLAGRNSSFALRGRPEAEIAQKLNVTHVVSGSVQRAGSQVRIVARLVNAADGTQLWQDRFTEEMKDIFAAQERIAGLIAQNLSLKLGGAARTAKAIDPEAQRLVLEGRYHWNQRTNEGFARAETAFTKAIALAPDFPEAHAGLAGVLAIHANFLWLEGQTGLADKTARARLEAAAALQLDPALAEAHAVLGFVHMNEREFALAEQSFERALAASPQSALVRSWYALMLHCMGRFDGALAQYQRAAELDPLWFINRQIWGNVLLTIGDPARALQVLGDAAALRSDVYLPNLGSRAMAHLRLGQKNEAVQLARQIRSNLDLTVRWQADAYAIHILRVAGHVEEADEYAKWVLPRMPPESYVRGFVLAALDRHGEAWPFLEHAPTTQLTLLMVDPFWSPVRDDPRMTGLMTRLRVANEFQVARETIARLQRERAGKK